MVGVFWAARVRRQSQAIVGPLFARMFLREDVLAALRSQPSGDPEIQAACLNLAEILPESADDCNRAAWELVRRPGRSEATYNEGLRLALASHRLSPAGEAFLGTLGVAQYRAGLMAEALQSLKRKASLGGGEYPDLLTAFMAMAHHKLGQPEKACAALDWFRKLMTEVGSKTDAGSKLSPFHDGLAFLAEAQAVVLYDPIFPADPFAH
jgi:hypothetical protein